MAARLERLLSIETKDHYERIMQFAERCLQAECQLHFLLFCYRFDWFVPEDQLKERTLDITVKNNVSFFSKSKTSMGQVTLLKHCH